MMPLDASEATQAAQDIPQWVQIIGFLVVTFMGAGFGSPLITGWLNRKKLDADVAATDATAQLTSVQTAEHAMNMVQKQLDSATARLDALEASNHRLEEANGQLHDEIAALRVSTAQEVNTLRQQLSEAQASNALLRQFIAEIRGKWRIITNEPFTDYDEWRSRQ